MECEFRDKCTFYEEQITKMPVSAIFYKKQYCDQDFKKCARNVIASKLGYDQVPRDLFPCQNVRAKMLTDGIIQVSKDSSLHTSGCNELPQKNDRNSYLSRGTASEKKALQLLKQYNGDKTVALGAYYAEVRSKHPGYVFTNEPKPDDEFYHAHIEYITIRNLIHTLAEKEVS